MSRTALLFLFLPTLIFGSYFELDHEFSRTIHPCQDFYKFVCNPDGNRNDSYMYTYGQKYIRVREILGAFKNYSDPISDFIRQIYIRYHRNRTLFEKGRLIGADVAIGGGNFDILHDVTKEVLTIIDWNALHLRSGDNFKTVNCVYKECPGYVKGIVFGFKNATDDDDHMDLQKLNITAKYVEVELTEKEKKRRDFPIFNGKVKISPIPYLNLLVAKFSTERNLWTSKATEDEFKKYAQVLVEETVAQIEKQAWIPDSKKATIIELMKRINQILFVPESLRNLDNVEEAIGFYVSEFKKYENYLKTQLRNESCGLTCLQWKIFKFTKLTVEKYQQKYGKTDKYVDILQTGRSFAKLYEISAYTTIDHLILLPALSFHLRDDLPVGFRYGFMARVLSHELFHSLDPKINIYPRVDKPGNILHGLKEYDEATKCYEDYYGSFGATAPNGTVFFPNGTIKKNEGFADVEGTRIALKALQKTLFSSRAFKSSYSYSAYNDFEWFFMGAMMLGCPKAGLDDFEEFKRTEMGVHPRLTIRVNAWVRQLDEFSKIFNCKPGDPMYVVDKQCKAFP